MSNQSSDHNRGPELLAITWTLNAISIAIVCLRLFTRLNIIRRTGLEDIIISLSLILMLMGSAVSSAGVHAGLGRHDYSLSAEQVIEATKLNKLTVPFYVLAFSLPNLSVAIFLSSILDPPRWQKWLLFGVTGLQSLAAGVECIITYAECSSVDALWDLHLTGNCLPLSINEHYSYFLGAYTSFTGVFLAVIPVAAFWKLQMKPKHKFGICILMGMTALSAICSIWKTTQTWILGSRADYTYQMVNLAICTRVEANAIVIAACVPTLRPFILSISHKFADPQPHQPSFLQRQRQRRRSGFKPPALRTLTNASETLAVTASGVRSVWTRGPSTTPRRTPRSAASCEEMRSGGGGGGGGEE